MVGQNDRCRDMITTNYKVWEVRSDWWFQYNWRRGERERGNECRSILRNIV